jgi:hypothetical protein
MSLGHITELEIEGLTAATHLSAVRDHSLAGIVADLQASDTNWNFRRGGLYDRPYLKNSSDGDAPVFMTNAEAFASYKAKNSLPALTFLPGDSLKQHSGNTDVLNDSGESDTSNTGTGYWALTHAAVAMAADAGITGAAAARDRVEAAVNYAPANANANNKPQWAIVSRTIPAWLFGKNLFEWVEIQGTTIAAAQSGFTSPGGSKEYVCSYSGGTVKSAGSELYVIGGGHADYAGNEVYSCRLADDVPAWTRRRNPTASVGSTSVAGNAYNSDGRPASRHTYWHLQFVNSLNRAMLVGGAALWGNGNGNTDTVDGFNPVTNDYDAAGTYASQAGIGVTSVGVAKDASERIYILNHNTGDLFRWTPGTPGTWTNLGNKGVADYETPMACDTTRNRILRARGSGVSECIYDLNSNGDRTNITFTGSNAGQITGGSLVYDPIVDCFWFWKRGSSTLYRIHPTTWAVTAQSVTGAAVNNSYVDGRHMNYGRFCYVPELKGLAFTRDVDSNVFFLRTA